MLGKASLQAYRCRVWRFGSLAALGFRVSDLQDLQTPVKLARCASACLASLLGQQALGSIGKQVLNRSASSEPKQCKST